MEQNRYYKTTTGMDPLTYVSGAVAYSDSADVWAFQADAVIGEIGLFDAITHALVPGNAAVADGTEVYIAALRTDLAGNRFVETSNPFIINKAARISKYPYEAPAKHKITLTAIASPTIVVGDVWSIKITDLTPANQPFPVQEYDYTVKTGDDKAAILAALVLAINNPLNPQNQGGDRVVLATTNGTTTLVLEALKFGTNFKVFTSNKAYGAFAAPVTTTQFKLGSGTPAQVGAFELESDTKKGVTTRYVSSLYRSEDFGAPVSAISAALTYVTYQFLPTLEESSPTPVEKHFRKNYIFLFVPATQTALVAAIDTLLGSFASTGV